MSRQLEQKREIAETKRRDALVKALEFGLAGALEAQGIQLLGFSAKFDAWECLITLKGEIAGVRSVAFVGSDNIISGILKAVQAAQYDRLKWKEDVYKSSGT